MAVEGRASSLAYAVQAGDVLCFDSRDSLGTLLGLGFRV